MLSTPQITKTTNNVKRMPYHELILISGVAYSPQLRPPETACVREKIVFHMSPKSSTSTSRRPESTSVSWRKKSLAPCKSTTAKMYITPMSSMNAQDKETRQQRMDATIILSSLKKRKTRMTRKTRTTRNARNMRKMDKLTSKVVRMSIRPAAVTSKSKAFHPRSLPKKKKRPSARIRRSTSRTKKPLKNKSTHHRHSGSPLFLMAARMSMSDMIPTARVYARMKAALTAAKARLFTQSYSTACTPGLGV
mmetsp:Transcript_90331/g.281206  ORF Transcript_90331/g.281206 Transcript_90331/m.281206 type:complete len:250 (-) Transcript_90331:565-1314(-)